MTSVKICIYGVFLSVLIFVSPLVHAKLPILLWNTLALAGSFNKVDLAKLQALEKQEYRVPGYMVPLEFAEQKTTGFLLVPSLPVCMHVPPPPPSQTIVVKFKDGKSAPIVWDPIWVEGRIRFKKTKNENAGEACSGASLLLKMWSTRCLNLDFFCEPFQLCRSFKCLTSVQCGHFLAISKSWS